ncbi:MAG: DUF721 domain-containing protein [Deltaproteobacteria bacterium]|nr:DUF721 domain-containing protein [Deltaproteobacteria bacterium]
MRGNRGRSSKTNGGSREGRAAERVSAILGSSFASLGISARIREYRIKKAWAGAVGPNISRRAAPIRLMGTVLYCAVSSSPWMTELSYQKPAIVARLNSFLGEATVSDIVFRIGKVHDAGPGTVRTCTPPRELTGEERSFIENTTSAIKDEGLKTLIKRVIGKSKG